MQPAQAAGFVVSIEAISFDATMMDTDDLATIRGASWAALEVCNRFADRLAAELPGVSVIPVHCGASKAQVRVRGNVGRDVIEAAVVRIVTLARPRDSAGTSAHDTLMASALDHMVFARATTADIGDDPLAANDRARAICQYQMLDVDLPTVLSAEIRAALIEDQVSTLDASRSVGARRDFARMATIPCSVDRRRPVGALVWESGTNRPTLSRAVSDSVAARRAFGRTGRRHHFYANQAGLTEIQNGFFLADSFEEIASDGGCPVDVPASVFGKMAVLSMDGNGFGRLQRAFVDAQGGGDDALGSFARIMSEKRRQLLRSLVELFMDGAFRDWLQLARPSKRFIDDPDSEGAFVDRHKARKPVLRCETLLNGADENLFVFPAWGLWLVLERLEQILAGPAGQLELVSNSAEPRIVPLTYSIGVAVANFRTPIRAVKALADGLSSHAKTVAKQRFDEGRGWMSLVDIMVLSGVDVPVRSLHDERKAVFLLEPEDQPDVFLLPLAGIGAYFERLSLARGEPGNPEVGISRKTMNEIYARAMNSKGARSCVGSLRYSMDPEILRMLKDSISSSYGQIGEKGKLLRFPSDFLWEGVREDQLRPLVPVHHLIEFWDLLVEHPTRREGRHGG